MVTTQLTRPKQLITSSALTNTKPSFVREIVYKGPAKILSGLCSWAFWLPLTAVGAGAICELGFAPYGIWPLTIIACAFYFAMALKIGKTAQAFIFGWFFGVGFFTAGLLWLFSGVGGERVPFLAVLLPLILIFGLALFPAVISVLVSSSRAPVFVKAAVIGPAIWVIGEWFRHQGALAFPWLTIGYTQIPGGPLAGYAPILGILGVSLTTLICSGLLSVAAVRGPFQQRFGALLAAALLIVVGLGFGKIDWTSPVGRPLRVALLQGNAPMTEKFSVKESGRALKAYATLAAQSDVPLIVLPETALPLFERQIPQDYYAFLRNLALERNGDIVISHFRDKPGSNKNEYLSSARSFGVSGEQFYDKQHLLPFGEFIPFSVWLRPVYERMAKVRMLDTSPGQMNQGSFIFGGHRVAIRMCYEDVFGNERRESLGQSQLLLTLVNDSWDGDTKPMSQHLQISQARALEAAKPILRAANTGWTVAIDHQGQVMDALQAETVGALVTKVQPRVGTTPYVVSGDALPMGLVGFGVLIAGMAEWRVRSNQKQLTGASL